MYRRKDRIMAAKPKTSEQKYYYSFDVIKLVCVFLCVTAGHYWQYSDGAFWASGDNTRFINLTNSFLHFSFRTYSLMELLLMISGIQMYRYYQIIRENGITFDAYLKKKAGRLLVLPAISAVIMNTGCMVFEQLTHTTWHDVVYGWRIMAESMLGIQSWINPKPVLNQSLWYLSSYFFCLVLFFWLVKLGRKTGMGIWVMMLPIIIGLFAFGKNYDFPFLNNELCRGYVGFFAGFFTAEIAARPVSKAKKRGLVVLCLVMISMWWFMRLRFPVYIYDGTPQADRAVISIILFYMPVLWILMQFPRLDRIIGNKVFRKAAGISFCLFVLNFPIYVWTDVLEEILERDLLPYTLPQGLWISIAIQILISSLVYIAGKLIRKQRLRRAARNSSK